MGKTKRNTKAKDKKKKAPGAPQASGKSQPAAVQTEKKPKDDHVHPDVPKLPEAIASLAPLPPTPVPPMVQSPESLRIEMMRRRSIDFFARGLFLPAQSSFYEALYEAKASGIVHEVVALQTSMAIVAFRLSNVPVALELCASLAEYNAPPYWPNLLCQAFALSRSDALDQAKHNIEMFQVVFCSVPASKKLKELKIVTERACQLCISGSFLQQSQFIDTMVPLGLFESPVNMFSAPIFQQSSKPKANTTTTQPSNAEAPKKGPINHAKNVPRPAVIKREEFDPNEKPPLLIPVGEVATTTPAEVAVFLDFDDMAPTDKLYFSEKAKDEGNTAFLQKDLFEALRLFTRAIKLHPENHFYFCNRALVYLKLDRFHEAISDCTASLQRQKNIKAFGRRGLAKFSLGLFEMALDDFREAHAMEKNNRSCNEDYLKCLQIVHSRLASQIAQAAARSLSPKTKPTDSVGQRHLSLRNNNGPSNQPTENESVLKQRLADLQAEITQLDQLIQSQPKISRGLSTGHADHDTESSTNTSASPARKAAVPTSSSLRAQIFESEGDHFDGSSEDSSGSSSFDDEDDLEGNKILDRDYFERECDDLLGEDLIDHLRAADILTEEKLKRVMESIANVYSQDPQITIRGSIASPNSTRPVDPEVEQWSQKIEREPKNASNFLERGQRFWSIGDLESAWADLRFSYSLDPQNKDIQKAYVSFVQRVRSKF